MSFLPVETYVEYILTYPHSVCFPVNEIKSFPHFVDNQVENLLTTRNYFDAKSGTAIFLSRGALTPNIYIYELRDTSGIFKGIQGLRRTHAETAHGKRKPHPLQ